MPIAIACVDCGFHARVKDHLAGRVVACPRCRGGIPVPEATTPPVEHPEPIRRVSAPRPAEVETARAGGPSRVAEVAEPPLMDAELVPEDNDDLVPDDAPLEAIPVDDDDDDDDEGEYEVIGMNTPQYAPARPSAGTSKVRATVAKDAAKTPSRPIGPTREAREILAAFRGEIEPVRPTLLYRLGLLVVALAMLMLPLIYLGLIAAAALATLYHATHSHVIFRNIGGSGGGAKAAVLLYVGPIIAGGALVVFMVKPLFARSVKPGKIKALDPSKNALLFAFVDGVCRSVGARTPGRIIVDCEVNASASFSRGPLALWSNDLTLTIGLPLVAGLDLRQFSGVLAHEFGHFSQGAGMRLTNIIRAVNYWFARLVYERDDWDAGLERLSASGGWLSIVGGLARLAIWLLRRVLWALMMVGHAISCFMLRQMEYDADRYETRMVGPEVFAETSRRLAVLGLAAQGAHADLAACWKENRLADDLTRLIAANVSQIPDEIRDRVVHAVETRKTGWLDTHPADADRIASSRADRSPGIFRLGGPATDLFRDFDALSRAVTRQYYRQVLGHAVPSEALTSVDEVVRGQEAVAEGNRGLDRFVLGAFDATRPFTLPAALPSIPDDPKAEAKQLVRVRHALVAARAPYTEALGRRREAIGRLVEVQAAADLLKAGFKGVKGAEFNLGQGRVSLPEAEAARQGQEAALLALDPEFEAFEEQIVARLRLGLGLLQSPAIDRRMPAADDWRSEAKALYPSAVHVAGRALPALVSLIAARGSLERSLGLLKGNEENQSYINGVLRGSRRVHERLVELRARLGDAVLYPFHHGEGAVGLARHALPPTLPGHEEVVPLYEVSGEAIDRVLTLHCRLLGRLALAVMEVEGCLGLPELAMPAEPEPEEASAAP